MDPTSPKVVRFSTDEWPEPQRIGAFREIYGRTIIKHDIEPIDDHSFHFEATLIGLPGLGLASAAISPCRAPRGPQHIDGDDLVLNLSLSGGRVVQQRGREALLREREAVLTTSADRGVVTVTSTSSLISLRIPRAILKLMIADLDDCLVRPIQRDTPALQLLIGYIGAIQNEIVLAKPALRDLIVAHVHDLVSLTLGATSEAGEIARARGARAARLAAILSGIERRSSDPGLSAITTALSLGVTPRYVHLLLEETGKSFTHHVLEKRLEKAAAVLREPQWRDRRIADIALEAGFTDLSHFSRAFRKKYGATPSDVRKAIRLE
jgi:AraC-like DNA-binding protein